MKNFDQGNLLWPTEDEEALTERVLKALSTSFAIKRQVSGDHPLGKRLRIDAIAKPLDASLWKNKSIALGIEFKSPYLSDPCELTGATAQLIDYSLTTWDGFGQVPVFLCPGLIHRTAPSSEYNRGFAYAFSRLMKDFNVGELLEHDFYGWSFVMAGRHDMWTARNGVTEGRNWSLTPKVGNRGVGKRAPHPKEDAL